MPSSAPASPPLNFFFRCNPIASMIRAILTSGSMRSLRHKPDRSCATKPGHTACHRQRSRRRLTAEAGALKLRQKNDAVVFRGLSRMETAMYRSTCLAVAMAVVIATSAAPAPALAAQDTIEPPRQTWDCDVPLDKLAEPAPLPHFAEALKTNMTLDIVAIGSSSTFGIGASTLDRTYPVQLQNILEKTFKGRDFFISNSGIGGEVAAQTAKRVRN